MKLYAIIDKRLPDAGITNVFPCPSDGYATRTIQTSLKGDNAYSMFPNDYKLVSIGEVNEKSGEITPFFQDIVEFASLVTKDE